MKSELFNDIEKLSAVWESHCEEDKEHRSVLVIGSDFEDGHERMFVNYVGKGRLIVSGILQFLQCEEAKDIAQMVVPRLLDLLDKDDKMRKVTGWTCVGSVAWVVFLVWLYFFSGLDGGDWKDFVGSSILPIWASVFTGYMYRRFAK